MSEIGLTVEEFVTRFTTEKPAALAEVFSGKTLLVDPEDLSVEAKKKGFENKLPTFQEWSAIYADLLLRD